MSRCYMEGRLAYKRGEPYDGFMPDDWKGGWLDASHDSEIVKRWMPDEALRLTPPA